MFQRVQVIVNTAAGAKFSGRMLKEIKEYLKKSGCFPVVTSTRYKNHAKIIAMDAVNNNFDLIISVGGDGTINEIINGMMDCKDLVRKLPALGIISSGTGADLCRTLNIPFEYQKGIDIIMKGKLMPLDIGVVKFKIGPHSYQRYFVNVFDVGLGGNVVRIANHIPKNLGGFLTFLLSSFAGLLTHTPVFLKIYVDDTLIDKDYITIIGAANGKFFGGGMQIAPMAEINDGYLEVLYVKNTNIFKFIKNVLIPVYDAKHLLYKHLYHYRAKRLKVIAKKIFLADIDGEEEKAQEVEVSIIPKQILVTIPG